MSFMPFPPLPIIQILPDLSNALAKHTRTILQALPGAGKTTIVPLHLMHEPWLGGRKILVLEPRRLAARAACTRMANLLGQQPGQDVGYITRLDSRTSKQTRVEMLTEGILTKRIQKDPELGDVGLIIFDEFHERSIHADLGLTLCLDIQENLREDLRILIMSATLDTKSIVSVLGRQTPVLTAPGQCYPVTTRYIPPEHNQRIEHHTAAVIQQVLADEPGSILVFLPGVPEINKVSHLLERAHLPDNTRVFALFGNQTRQEQDKALEPAPQGSRKVVLATSIAETSLTIQGIRVVIDTGLCRVSRYSPRTGMDRLETVPVSRSSADQRRGRAGRMEPGTCFRLWSKTRHATLPAHLPPEITTRDLCSLVLTLADWGVTDTDRLSWITPPPPAHVDKARDLLFSLGALDQQGRITRHGRDLQHLGTHPRLAHLILEAQQRGMAWTGCVTAALFMERDILPRDPGREPQRDIRLRLDVLQALSHGQPCGRKIHRAAAKRILAQARIWRSRLKAKDETLLPESCGPLLALAFPDRIAYRRSADTRETGYLLANGKAARFPVTDPLTAFSWLVIPELDDKGKEAVIQLAAPLEQSWLEEHLSSMWQTREAYAWDLARKEVMAQKILSFGKITVKSSRLAHPDPHKLQEVTLRAIEEHGLDLLPWKKGSRLWLERVRFLIHCGLELPAHDNATLLAELETWLEPFLPRPIPRLENIDLLAALKSRLSWNQQQLVEKQAPTHLTVPSGSRIPVKYEDQVPVLAARIQELFGWQQTPKIAQGRVGVCIHLLSPAHRPVQITSDLAGFWQTGYPAVKKELKGRYPKHYWPDDPLTARATRTTKKGMGL
jgi:ATP-dependent helicase HrpB